MVKSELVDELSKTLNLTHKQAESAVDAFFDALTDGLAEGKRVEIRGFGSFSSRQYDGYVGRNPKTGDSVTVAPKVLPHYKAGKEMRDAVNK